jgi:hypothetical protein
VTIKLYPLELLSLFKQSILFSIVGLKHIAGEGGENSLKVQCHEMAEVGASKNIKFLMIVLFFLLPEGCWHMLKMSSSEK